MEPQHTQNLSYESSCNFYTSKGNNNLHKTAFSNKDIRQVKKGILQSANRLINFLNEQVLVLEDHIFTADDEKVQSSSEVFQQQFDSNNKQQFTHDQFIQNFLFRQALKKSLNVHQAIDRAILNIQETIDQTLASLEAFKTAYRSIVQIAQQKQTQINDYMNKLIPQLQSYKFTSQSITYALQLANNDMSIQCRYLNIKERQKYQNKQYKAVFNTVLNNPLITTTFNNIFPHNKEILFRIETQGFASKDQKYFEYGFIDSAYESAYIEDANILSPQRTELLHALYKVSLKIQNFEGKFYFISNNRAKLIDLNHKWEYFGFEVQRKQKNSNQTTKMQLQQIKLKEEKTTNNINLLSLEYQQYLVFYGIQVTTKLKQTGKVLKLAERKEILAKNQKNQKKTKEQLFDFQETKSQIVKIKCPQSFSRSIIKGFFQFKGITCKVHVRAKESSKGSPNKEKSQST